MLPTSPYPGKWALRGPKLFIPAVLPGSMALGKVGSGNRSMEALDAVGAIWAGHSGILGTLSVYISPSGFFKVPIIPLG